MRFLSICSGIEAASVAFAPLGWKAVGFSEIDPFPCAVLAHYYPDVPNFGDMTRFQEWPDLAVDLVCGGTPCQAFSVAGLRQGLADPRGNLALTFLAIVDRYRPQWVLWENVHGVLSSNGGRDFGAFLGGLGHLGYGWCYRVLDAQYVRVDGYERAVPQRRRRVFVVGYLGDWRRAAAVLSEPESVLGNSPPRREAGQRPAPTLSARTQGGGGLGTDFECDGGLIPQALRGVLDGIRGTLVKGNGNESGGAPCIATGWAVRRLTPIECERLQGFPDGYTAVPYRGKPAADGPRYKALGNSWAVNCARWIGCRINLVESVSAELSTPVAAE
jgi:DNA (cytosine-5)-methyltransferase 1